MRSYRKRPSRLSSVMAVVVGIGMLIFAFSQFSNQPRIGIGNSSGSSGGGFIILWGVALVGIIGYHIYNAMTGKGYSDSIDLVESDREEESSFRRDFESTNRSNDEKTVEERLHELSSLRDKGLISESEFTRKRSEIIDEL